MNHYAAREIYKDGRATGLWHYTVANRRTGTYAVGYCSGWITCPACKGECGRFYDDKRCEVCNSKGMIDDPKPCPGHATPAGACDHYRDYLLDGARIVGPSQNKWPKYKCEIDGCDEEGTYLANVDSYQAYPLCPQHANKEALKQLVHVGDSWSS